MSLSAQCNADYEQYIQFYAPIAVEQMKLHKIPASITLAQGLLESAAGKSRLARYGNNHFGIKCHDWKGKKQYQDDDAKNDCFRVYNNARESYEDHSQFLKKSRYQKLFTYKITDYKSWAYGLKSCGYATSPTYAQNLIRVIETYQLYKYDTGNYSKTVTYTGKYGNLSTSIDPVQYINQKAFIRARKGDTYKTIGKRLGISYRKLARYNEKNKKALLTEGEIVFLEKKARRGAKSLKGKVHVIKAGESMHSISQMYGIRMKRLYKMNKLSPDSQISVGQTLKLR